MSNLIKLAAMSLVRVWPAVHLSSADSHGILLLNVGVSVQFWSRHFSSAEWFEANVFKHSPTLPMIIVFIVHSTDLINNYPAKSRGISSDT